MTEEIKPLSFQISGNSSVVIINLAGHMNPKSAGTIEGIRQALIDLVNMKCVIFNFAQVESISVETISAFAQLQKTIRERRSEIRICAMKESIKEKLNKSGTLRSNEIAEDSKSAIYSLSGNRQKVA